MLRIAENLTHYRKLQHLTQADVAEHLGVTKASVSKWETGQTLPDVALLPLIASFFGVTLDELMGYEPGLTREQIRRLYQDYSRRFAEEDFEVVFGDLRQMIRRYYSCYPFLSQVVVLLLNYVPAVENEERRGELYRFGVELCQRIEEKSENGQLRANARSWRTVISLQTGAFQDVIEELSDITDPDRMEDMESLLAIAHMSLGNFAEAEKITQISIYKQVMLTLQHNLRLMMLQAQDPKNVRETMRRTEALMEAYDVEHLNPNTAAAYSYQAALQLIGYGDADGCICQMERYVRASIRLFRDHLEMHGDDYFTCIGDWFAESALGSTAVRDKKAVLKTVLDSFDHPALQVLGEDVLKRLRQNVQQGCEEYM